MIIKTWHENTTVLYAADELKKYLDMMDPGFCDGIDIVNAVSPDKADGVIKLGLLSDFGFDTSDVIDFSCDDVVYIDIVNGSGIIAGSNVRSILLSVYAYLREAGCAFIRPGDDGEIIPERDMSSFSYTYRKLADYPFRGECIEGAPSYEHICDTIIWSPKVGMNLFMLEQVVPFNYMSRWYKHKSSTVAKDENVSFEDVCKMIKDIELLIKKCGLQLHSLGHGYLLEPYGIKYIDNTIKYELTEEARKDIAFYNGKRELIGNSPNFTHLCYSDKKVRKKLVDWLVGYMQEKPYIDFLHVWLADGTNNHCECPNCINERISDLYVKLLNEVDEEFTRLGIDTRIVFILYVDTLWAPLYEKIKNPARFYMMTATTGRDFRKPLDSTLYEGETPPYIKNKYSIDCTFPLTMRFTEEWKRAFQGRMLFFEYNMYVHQYNDPGFMNISKVWLEEAKNLISLNVHGTMCDQTQRSFFPNGLPNSIYGAAMFDKEIEFEPFCEQYFKAAYGADYKLALDYLTEISERMSFDMLQVNLDIVDLDPELGSKKKIKVKPWIDNPKAQADLQRVIDMVDNFEGVAKAHLSEKHATQRRSWELLLYHTDYCRRYAHIMLAQSLGDEIKAKKLYDEMIDVYSHLEPEISSEFDLFLFDKGTKRKFE